MVGWCCVDGSWFVFVVGVVVLCGVLVVGVG